MANITKHDRIAGSQKTAKRLVLYEAPAAVTLSRFFFMWIFRIAENAEICTPSYLIRNPSGYRRLSLKKNFYKLVLLELTFPT